MYDFLRAGAAVPRLSVANCDYNRIEILRSIAQAQKQDIKVLTFPELCLTAYTCGDLFAQTPLLESALNSLSVILYETQNVDMLIILGMPLCTDNQCFNCAVAIHKGKILGVVPKTVLPNYGEFYEKRWFSSSEDAVSDEITLLNQIVPFGTDILFCCDTIPHLVVGIEICEDLWSPVPPSSFLSLYGATIIANPSASNELATKYSYRTSLISQQSARCVGAYVYASAGVGESTQDMVFSGHSIISENGALLAESLRFQKNNQIIFADIDLELLVNDRKKNPGYMSIVHKVENIRKYRKIYFSISNKEEPATSFARKVSPYPFIPAKDAGLGKRCEDIFAIQTTGLAKRIEHTNAKTAVIGISGGLDSTLALLVAVKSCDWLEIDRKQVLGITMPGFGTTDRTYQNALNLIKALGATLREIPINAAALEHFKNIGHDPNVHDVTYENTQARERTQILMDVANMEKGLVVGTGDLSELALGWATYNGDHMSMYGVNAGIPKTLVRVLVRWVAETQDLGPEAKKILLDVLDTPVSPELLPPDKDGKINQKTEELVGPYELHDFFLYYVVRFGFSPAKILFLAENAFQDIYSRPVILKWLRNFYSRFFSQQFKRSCLPDGPKVGTISLSPRGDWRMPSDASAAVWLKQIDAMYD